MTVIDTERVMRLADVARLAGVAPSAVSNWRKRKPEFPKPVAVIPGWGNRGMALELFDRAQIEQWLESRQMFTQASLEAREARLREELADVQRRLSTSRPAR